MFRAYFFCLLTALAAAVAHAGILEPFSKLASAALNPVAHPADSGGRGVRAGTLEFGPVTELRKCFAGTGDTVIGHEHQYLTYACLVNAAPLVDARHFEAAYFDDTGRVYPWIIGDSIEVVSMSVDDKAGQTLDPSARAGLCADEIVYRWPRPLLVFPAGNNGFQTEAIHQAYNAISVGSSKHWQEREYAVDLFTQARNPDTVYGGCADSAAPCVSDREMPEILAPGSHPYEPVGDPPDTYVWHQPCIRGFFPGSGTSFATPTLAGIAVRLISSAPAQLKHRPEAVKMALLLTAHNVEDGYWNPAVDGHDGAGTVSGYDAVAYISSCVDLSGREPRPAAEHGFFWGMGTDTMVRQQFTVRVPDTPPSDSHLRAVLVWTSNPDLVEGKNYLSDLNLDGFEADGVSYGSYSADASVEMFDVPRERLTPGSEYTFSIAPDSIRIPPNAGTDYFYYALGWTWVRDSTADVPVAPPAVSRKSRWRMLERHVRIEGGRWLVADGALSDGERIDVVVTALNGAALVRGVLDETQPRVALPSPAAGVVVVEMRSGNRAGRATVLVRP